MTRTGSRPLGLCDSCRHQRLVRTTRGSEFSLCERARSDARYAKYPPLPVVRCPGHEPRGEPGSPPSSGGVAGSGQE